MIVILTSLAVYPRGLPPVQRQRQQAKSLRVVGREKVRHGRHGDQDGFDAANARVAETEPEV